MRPTRSAWHPQALRRLCTAFVVHSLTGDGACCVYLPSMEAEGRTPAELAGCMREGPLRLANTSCRKL